MKTPRIVIDFETRSHADLKKVGAWKYAKHPTTRVLCMGYKIEQQPTRLWWPRLGPFPRDVGEVLRDPRVDVVAHNAFFEQVIFEHVLRGYDSRLGRLIADRWRCTAAKARAHGLPGNLEGACSALALPIQKDKEGHRLMLKYCKPRSQWVKSGEGDEYHNDEAELERLGRYCMTDVDAEAALDDALDNLSPDERQVWLLDQSLNSRGVYVDVPTVKRVLVLIEEHAHDCETELEGLTAGLVGSASQREALLNWCNNEGADLSAMRKADVDDALNLALPDNVRRALEIRQSVAKSSTAKFEAFLNRVDTDNRVRDLLTYHGASTGRWAGSGLQIQNFPKGNLSPEAVVEAIDIINNHDLDFIKLIYGDPMPIFSSILRGMITAPPGSKLVCADFSQIEVRVLWWLAHNVNGLKLFEGEGLVYEAMASEIYAKPITLITKGERNLGKATVLGAGFSMGPKKFYETCRSWGIPVDEETAARSIASYRAAHPSVVKMWSNLEKAAIYAVEHKGSVVKINRTAWKYDGQFLWCKLPSGRKMAYYNPTIESKPTPWGESRPELRYWTLDSQTKKWTRIGTYGGKLTENVTQAVARDVMVGAMVKAQKAGYNLTMSVHDELVGEVPIDGNLNDVSFTNILKERPQWALDCPIDAAGWEGERYQK